MISNRRYVSLLALSATLARVSGAEVLVDDHDHRPLEPRELQIARLAVSGRSNVEIALALGIGRETVKQTLRRVHCKLDVSGRAQMAATMTARGWIPPCRARASRS